MDKRKLLWIIGGVLLILRVANNFTEPRSVLRIVILALTAIGVALISTGYVIDWKTLRLKKLMSSAVMGYISFIAMVYYTIHRAMPIDYEHITENELLISTLIGSVLPGILLFVIVILTLKAYRSQVWVRRSCWAYLIILIINAIFVTVVNIVFPLNNPSATATVIHTTGNVLSGISSVLLGVIFICVGVCDVRDNAVQQTQAE